MERRAPRFSGWLAILIIFALIGGTIWVAVFSGQPDGVVAAVIAVAAILVVLLASGLAVISPNDAWVFQFFGKYVGTIDRAGFHCTIPLTERKKVSKRVRNFETARLKVSDADGNPVEIAA